MKLLKNLGIVLLAILALTGCKGSENDGTAERLKQEKDSLLNITRQQQSMLDEMNGSMAEIAACLDTISMHEQVILSGIDENGNRLSRKALRSRLDLLAKVIEEQKGHLGELSERLANANLKIDKLTSIITFLENSLSQKDSEVERLKGELSSSNYAVATLSQKVDNMADTISNERAANTEHRREIARQDAQLNEVFYVIGTEKELIAKGILSKEGKIIKKKKVNFANINKAYLTKADMRSLSQITIHGKSPKLLSEAPKGSYQLQSNGGVSTLKILNPSQFWSANNRILIIQVK